MAAKMNNGRSTRGESGLEWRSEEYCPYCPPRTAYCEPLRICRGHWDVVSVGVSSAGERKAHRPAEVWTPDPEWDAKYEDMIDRWELIRREAFARAAASLEAIRARDGQLTGQAVLLRCAQVVAEAARLTSNYVRRAEARAISRPSAERADVVVLAPDASDGPPLCAYDDAEEDTYASDWP